MTEAELLQLLGQARTRAEAAAGPPPSDHPQALTFARAQALALNPARRTEAERQHLASCRRCARLVASFERNAVHPSLWELASRLLGTADTEEAEFVQRHLEQDECRRCQLVLRSPWLRGLAALASRGREAAAQARAVLEAARVGFAPLPAAAGDFGTRPDRPTFQLRVGEPEAGAAPVPADLPDESGYESEAVGAPEGSGAAASLTATARETERREWQVYVEAADEALAGRTVHVEVVGEREALAADITLERWAGHRCDGRHAFGPFADVASRLGPDCVLVVAPADVSSPASGGGPDGGHG